MLKKIFPILMLIIILLGCNQKRKEKNEISKQEFGARKVKVVSVKRTNISSYLEYSGTLEAENIVNITPAIPTVIKKIFVREGDKIKTGDLLLQMDETNLTQAKSNYLNLKEKFERMKKLKETGSIDEQSFEDVQTAYQIAESTYRFALENTEIRTPIDGTVTLVAQKEGETYNSMLTPVLIRIVNTEKMIANIHVSDKDIALIKEKQQVEIQIDNKPNEIFHGTVYFKSPEADKFSGTFQCKISVNNSRNLLKHNQFAKIRIILKTVENALIIPQKAVTDEQFVFVAEKGIAKKKMIKTGIENESEVEVITGLEEGANVIIEGIVGLKDGNKIEIRK